MLLKHLFCIKCQITVAYRAIHSLHFHHLWAHHTVNYIFPPHMWVRHTVRNVGLSHLGFSFPVGLPPSSVTVAFRATKISTTLRVNIPVAKRATKNLEDTMLSLNYRSWQRSFSKLPNSCQQWELTFLSTVAFRATKILTILWADVHFSITCASTTQWITLFLLTCGSTLLWEMWVCHI